MSEPTTRAVTLGGRTFDVPPLPLAITMLVYPILRKLNNNGFIARWLDGIPSDEDVADLVTVIYGCAKAADPGLNVEAFHALAITPAEMFEGYGAARIQSGGWKAVSKDDAEGESQGEPKPQTSTSAESSPS